MLSFWGIMDIKITPNKPFPQPAPLLAREGSGQVGESAAPS
jgi:hypothetical protein